jgi:hypothetical protein
MLHCAGLLLSPRLLSRAPGLQSLESPQEWWLAARVCGDEVEENGWWMKMVAKVEFQTLGCWGEYIGDGLARLEGNRDIEFLPFLQCFSEKGPYGPFYFVANDFCWSRDTSIGVEAQFGTRFLSSLAWYPWNAQQAKAELNLEINMLM